MTGIPELRGDRVVLRGWRETDLEPFAAMNDDERVMERLGMSYDGEFEHPRFPTGHRLCTHVLYGLARR